MREFNEDEYIEVISRQGYYYHRFYPNKLYVNGINKHELSSEEFKHVQKSKTTIQLRKEQIIRLEKKMEKQQF